MKRFLSIMLCLALIIALPVCAYAAGRLTVTQENFFVTDSWGYYGYCFACIENTGDKPVEFSAGLLEMYDENGDTLASDTYFQVYGDYLQPGEYGYVKIYEDIEDINTYTEVADYMLTVTGKSSSGTVCQRFECEAAWLPDYPTSKYWTDDIVAATFTNTTDETVYGIEVVMALLDDDGNILDIESVDLYDNVGIGPGSTVTVYEEVSSSIIEAFERDGYTATHVDAFAYVYIEED